jgi:hypothetical protein
MNGMIRITVFVLCLNFAIGVLALIPGLDLTQQPQLQGGLVYTSGYSENFTTILGENPNVQNDVSSGWFNSILDIVGLGFISRILDVLNQYLYGFLSQLLIPIFGPYLPETLASIIFTTGYTVITILYIFGAISLFINKDLTQG